MLLGVRRSLLGRSLGRSEWDNRKAERSVTATEQNRPSDDVVGSCWTKRSVGLHPVRVKHIKQSMPFKYLCICIPSSI